MNTIKISLGKVDNSCFVVMPFSSLFQTEYEKIIQPALLELKIVCIRGDEIYTKQRIIDDLWHSIKKCRFVLAELTGKNPNVLYEIGLAHAIGKPVIIITRNSDDVPFDLKALRYLFYDVNDPFWGDNLKAGIQNLAKKVIENPTIENYLDGITHDDIKYPELPTKSFIQPKLAIPLFDVTGIWFGEFTNDSGLVHKVTLQLNQNENVLTGSAIITYIKKEKQTVIQQMLNANIKNDTIELHGVNYTYIERGDSLNYELDTFIMNYNKENDSLIGLVNTNNMDGTIIKKEIEFIKM